LGDGTEINHLENLSVGRRIILKTYLKQDRESIVLLWLRTGTEANNLWLNKIRGFLD
jgi:hypothetical protein